MKKHDDSFLARLCLEVVSPPTFPCPSHLVDLISAAAPNLKCKMILNSPFTSTVPLLRAGLADSKESPVVFRSFRNFSFQTKACLVAMLMI